MCVVERTGGTATYAHIEVQFIGCSIKNSLLDQVLQRASLFPSGLFPSSVVFSGSGTLFPQPSLYSKITHLDDRKCICLTKDYLCHPRVVGTAFRQWPASPTPTTCAAAPRRGARGLPAPQSSLPVFYNSTLSAFGRMPHCMGLALAICVAGGPAAWRGQWEHGARRRVWGPTP